MTPSTASGGGEPRQNPITEYLDGVPQDDFDGETVRYSKASRVVYSIGDDFVDDGALEGASQINSAAPGVSIAF